MKKDKESFNYKELYEYYKGLPFSKVEEEFKWVQTRIRGQWRGNALVSALLIRLCNDRKNEK